MSRRILSLWNEADRKRALRAIWDAPDGSRLEFLDPQRSLDQNSRLFLILTEVSKLHWRGQFYSVYDWKDYFMHAYRGEKWMPAEDGGMVPIGRSTSKLSKYEFGELMELIEAFCARQNIDLPWVEPAAPEQAKP